MARQQPAVRPAVQARSRATRDRLLDAAESLLREGGPEAATVPAIAERAGVAVGSVYRRFPDKDAVLRRIYERFFEHSAAVNAAALQPVHWQSASLPALLDGIIDAMVEGYRRHASLLAALIRYVDGHPDHEFRRRADRLRGDALAGMRTLLLVRRREIRHPDPDLAVDILLLTVAFVLKGVVLHGTRSPSVSGGWDVLARELRRIARGYLGVSARR